MRLSAHPPVSHRTARVVALVIVAVMLLMFLIRSAAF